MSVIRDGAFVNQEAASCSGCKCGSSFESIVSSFPHPTHSYLVYMIFDVCHMLELLRNTLQVKNSYINQLSEKYLITPNHSANDFII